jgi:hypothetical protein
MSTDDIFQRLALIARERAAHEAALWLLGREVDELRQNLRQMNWQPPTQAIA